LKAGLGEGAGWVAIAEGVMIPQPHDRTAGAGDLMRAPEMIRRDIESRARLAVFFGMPTGQIGKLSQPGCSLFGIEHSNDGPITFPGGCSHRKHMVSGKEKFGNAIPAR
jgi:hypothetical protein